MRDRLVKETYEEWKKTMDGARIIPSPFFTLTNNYFPKYMTNGDMLNITYTINIDSNFYTPEDCDDCGAVGYEQCKGDCPNR